MNLGEAPEGWLAGLVGGCGEAVPCLGVGGKGHGATVTVTSDGNI